jgi:hypothetical protein
MYLVFLKFRNLIFCRFNPLVIFNFIEELLDNWETLDDDDDLDETPGRVEE